uniref:Down syndrome cell adhesion molecule n=1 Tax=Strigamia maritima TaxID=126957 RepID=T1J767_STRMM
NQIESLEIVVNTQHLQLESGGSQGLVCDVKGAAEFAISWYRNGDLMPNKNGMKNLNLDQSGIYQCFVKSEDDMVHATAQVTSGKNKPKIIKKFEERILHPGDSVNLECKVSSNPVATITWYLDDQKLSTSDSIIITEKVENNELSASVLSLNKLTVENGGTYSCQAINNVGIDTYSARINVYGKLGMRSMTHTTVVAGDSFIINCPFYGYPISNIEWQKDSQGLPVMFHQKAFPNGTLIVSNVKKGLDDGKYSCIVSNIQSERAVGTVEMVVMIAPKIMPFSFQEDLLREGMRARLQCVVSEGDSPITIQWLKDNAKIPAELDIKIQPLDEFSSILNIGHVTPKHNGNYTCQARNAAATIAYSAVLNVNVPPKIIPFAFVDDQFYKGMRAHITCAVSQGDPPLNFRWLKDDRPIISSSTDVLTQQYDKYANSLSIESVSSVHTGNYTCVVSNRAVTVSHTAQLLVHVAPRIIPFSFQDKSVAEGRQARVMCGLIEGDAPVTFTWLKDGVPIKQTDIEISRVDDNYSILSIHSVHRGHTGNYTCVATNGATSSQFTAPKIVPFSFQDDQLFEGVFARVSCVVYQGDLPITIKWLKDNQPLSTLEGVNVRQVDQFSSMLTIEKVQQVHSGNYTCTATNSAASASSTAILVVNVPPKIVPFTFQDGHLLEGMLVRVSCVISRGDLPLNISWLKNDKQLPEDHSINVHNLDDYSSVLSIDPVTKKHDGNYTCIAKNMAGSDFLVASLIVYELPKWVVKPNNTKISVGSSALMPCITTGFPKPKTTWYKVKGSDSRGETDVVKNENGYKLLANGSLEIHNVNLKHAGYYFCLSNNTIGSISAMALLSISFPPQIHKKLQNNTVQKGDSVYFKCVAHGDQPMKFIWYVNGQAVNQTTSINGYLIKQSNDTASVTSEFAIKKTERKHSTSFICSAENSYGTENATFNLLVLETPDPPRDIKIIEANNRTVVIGWQTPFDGNMPVNKFILQYKLVADTWETGVRNLTLPGHKLQSAISSLKPSANYNVRIIAGNDIGMSLPSEEIEVLMPDQAPAGPPLNVNAIATDSNSLKVSSGAYQFRMLEVPEDYTATLSLPINDLHTFTQYSVVVQAFNDGGKGPLSKQVIAVTSESIPTKPPRDIKCSVLSSQSIHLTWQPPPQSSIHGMLQGFKINYKPVTDQSKYSITRGVRTLCRPDTCPVRTPVQSGHLSSPDTMAEPSQSPAMLKYRCRPDTCPDQTEFCAPPVSGPHIEDATPQIQSLNGTSTKMTVRNLEKFTNYSVQISAMTRMGDGVKSEPVFCRTLEDIPSAPSDVKVFPVSAQSIIIAWKPPNRANGLITKYTVYEKQSGSTSAAKIAGFGTTIVITQGEDVLLACKSVGMPPPQQKWMSDGNGVDLDTRHATLGDGSLLIKDTDEHDSDNYTCHVQNEHGQDYITYNLIIQSAPGVPFVEISLVTTSSIDIQWKVDRNGGSPIQGYKLYYKHDQSDWEIIDLDGGMNSYHLDGLHCGTKYQLYMVAYNKLGQGKATQVISAGTKGGIPISPSKSKLIEEGSTYVTINLDSWLVDKCPIKYFVVEYKTRNSAQWRLLSDDITSEKHKLSLSDLSPATWYNLRIITHSSAGTAAAEYTFATLAVDGDLPYSLGKNDMPEKPSLTRF